MSELIIRDAIENDLPAIDDIYNHYVLNATCTWQCEPTSAAQRRLWFGAHDAAHPVTVAMQGGEIVGWGSLSVYNVREGYRYTVENTVYVRHDCHRRGIGGAILRDLLERAKELDYHTVIASISADQEASIGLHARAGFVEVGRMKELGHKFGRWIDCVYLQKLL